jgi:hypothetical protein
MDRLQLAEHLYLCGSSEYPSVIRSAVVDSRGTGVVVYWPDAAWDVSDS